MNNLKQNSRYAKIYIVLLLMIKIYPFQNDQDFKVCQNHMVCKEPYPMKSQTMKMEIRANRRSWEIKKNIQFSLFHFPLF